MGNSTISLQDVIDFAAAKAIPVPTLTAGAYGSKLAVKIGNDVMAEIIAERFNWKWNRAVANPFYTNSFQQDYPQIGLVDVGWLEDADRIEINNTAVPKPLRQLTCRRQLSRSGLSWTPIAELCWMYNSLLSYGTWPGASVVYSPLVASIVQQNPLMNIVDANGNLLVLTTFGTTGLTAPALPAKSAEGATVNDGTCMWTVVSATSQGFRVNPLPGAAGPVFQVIPYYQKIRPTFATLQQNIDPIPDDFSQYFQVGYETFCLQASPNPGDRARFLDAKQDWLKSMDDVKKQGDREADAYAMLPATSPVENVYAWVRNPQDPSQPY